ncbi:hypothetical protein F4823DRAFT_569243 [Ustulina deusta]|nr:hypothetical protein F4823DRAFT_569243 [Ustulina deusta]
MPIAAIGLIVGDALTATGAVVNCYKLHKCGHSNSATSILSRINVNIPGHDGRQGVGPCNVPQYNFDLCQNDLRGVTVQTSISAEGEAQFDNVPATCMVLSTVLTGACGSDGPTVTPCGSACLAYTSLTVDELNQLSQALSPYSS